MVSKPNLTSQDAEADEGPSESKARVELEAMLFRQEHRVFNLANRFFFERKRYGKSDPRRKAIERAFLWRIVFGILPTVTIATVGIGSLIAIWLSWESNSLMREQNSSLVKQNSMLARQYFLSERVKFLTPLYETIQSNFEESTEKNWEPPTGDRSPLWAANFEKWHENQQKDSGFPLPKRNRYTPKANVVVRSSALLAFIELERSNQSEKDKFKKTNLPFALLQNVVVPPKTDLTKVNFNGANFWGAKLAEVNFRGSDLSGVELGGADLIMVDFSYSTLALTDFRNIMFPSVNFSHSNLMYSDFENAKLLECDLTNANLNSTNLIGVQLSDSDLSNANLSGAMVDSLDWLDKLKGAENPPKIDYEMWSVKKSPLDKSLRIVLSRQWKVHYETASDGRLTYRFSRR